MSRVVSIGVVPLQSYESTAVPSCIKRLASSLCLFLTVNSSMDIPPTASDVSFPSSIGEPSQSRMVGVSSSFNAPKMKSGRRFRESLIFL